MYPKQVEMKKMTTVKTANSGKIHSLSKPFQLSRYKLTLQRYSLRIHMNNHKFGKTMWLMKYNVAYFIKPEMHLVCFVDVLIQLPPQL